MKRKLKSITVDGYVYRYGVSHTFDRIPLSHNTTTYRWLSRDVFTAYLASQKIGSLIIHFQVEDDPIRGSPLRTGMPINSNSSIINIHTPAIASELIRYARSVGWNPDQVRTPFLIKNGLATLVALGYTIE